MLVWVRRVSPPLGRPPPPQIGQPHLIAQCQRRPRLPGLPRPADFVPGVIRTEFTWPAFVHDVRMQTRSAMAAEMDASRAQLNRVLDTEEFNVTLETLSRAAKVVGRGLQVGLV